MTIAFIHPHKSFLPEIDAYIDFFNTQGIDIRVIHSKTNDTINADVEWYFMGMYNGNKKKSTIVIHEYASASVPPFHKEKDFLKRSYNPKPDYRLFLNQYVKERLNFKDNIPFGFRDMGIPDLFFQSKAATNKEYDFIYTGSIEPGRRLEKLLQCFTKNDLQTHSILILSKGYQYIATQFASFSNIDFKGPVPHEAMAEYISKARFCINYVPDKEPFNQQTSVKFLEYLALKIPVISSKYPWTEQFQQQHGGDFFYLEKDLSNFTWKNVNQHNYSFPDLHNWNWNSQIKKSGICEFLQSKFKELRF